MCELYLGEGNPRRDIDNETALKTWATSREGLLNYLNHCEADTYFIAAIAIKIQMLPLTKVLTNLAGNSWARTLSGTRAERNEYILLHEFHRNKYICPDKVYGKGKAKVEEEHAEGEEAVDVKKKDKFKGGLVFEPEKGLYDKFILVMDFNSLYPSIIQEFNICFTTVDRSDLVSLSMVKGVSKLELTCIVRARRAGTRDPHGPKSGHPSPTYCHARQSQETGQESDERQTGHPRSARNLGHQAACPEANSQLYVWLSRIYSIPLLRAPSCHAHHVERPRDFTKHERLGREYSATGYLR